MKVEGGCHCGLVRFEADVPEGPVEISDCNCTICAMTGYLHLIVPETAFRLIEGKRETTTYPPHLLRPVRHQELLQAAVASPRHQHQPALPRR